MRNPWVENGEGAMSQDKNIIEQEKSVATALRAVNRGTERRGYNNLSNISQKTREE